LAAVGKRAWLGAVERLDRRLYRAANRGLGPPADAFFTGITELGSIWASVGATVALSAGGRRREALDAMAAALAMWAIGQAAKKAVRRPRPYQALPEHRLLIKEPQGTSWPSSHPAVLLTYVAVVTRNLGSPPPVARATRALAWTVGASRVYVGVHYPGDVVGGMLMARGVARLWSSLVSPRTVGSPGTVTR
jgi:undecaprenyl-diphosphatase